MCVCASCVTHTYRDSGLVGVTEVSVFPGCGLGWMNRVVPSHVGSPAPWAESRIPLMWTPTFPGLLPGKNRVVCLGFGGKSVPRNVTLWGAWGGLARRPCISQLLRLRDNLGGQGGQAALSPTHTHSLKHTKPTADTTHTVPPDWALGRSVDTERHSALPRFHRTNAPYKAFHSMDNRSFLAQYHTSKWQICLLRSPETHPSA